MKLRYKISIWVVLALAGSLLCGGSVWLWLVGICAGKFLFLYITEDFLYLAHQFVVGFTFNCYDIHDALNLIMLQSSGVKTVRIVC